MFVTLKGDKRTLLKYAFKIMNAIQEDPAKEITPGEMDILTELLLLPLKFGWQRFTPPARKKARLAIQARGFHITAPSINTRVSRLVDKGVVIRDEDNVLRLDDLYEDALTNILNSIDSDTESFIAIKLVKEDGATKERSITIGSSRREYIRTPRGSSPLSAERDL